MLLRGDVRSNRCHLFGVMLLLICGSTALEGIQVRDFYTRELCEKETLGKVALKAHHGRYIYVNHQCFVNDHGCVGGWEPLECVLWEEGGFITKTKNRLQSLEEENRRLNKHLLQLQQEHDQVDKMASDPIWQEQSEVIEALEGKIEYLEEQVEYLLSFFR